MCDRQRAGQDTPASRCVPGYRLRGASTRQGRRPSLDAAAKPEKARVFFDATVEKLRQAGVPVETGRFGAEMLVEIKNDGPLTLIVESPRPA